MVAFADDETDEEKFTRRKKRVQISGDLVEKQPRVNKIPYQDIKLGEFVGRGTYGVVFQAVWNKKGVAVKSIGDRNGSGTPKEVSILSKVQHPHIIDFYGYSEKNNHIFLVMEYADCGSLYDIIHRSNSEYGAVEYTPAHVLNWGLQCAEAMDYLHTRTPKAIIHRDLKPSNILLSHDCEIVKICDFGEARTFNTVMTAGSGTPLWMAPEVINSTKYTEKCDVYSFGIILWEMISRKKPYYDLEVEGQGIFLAVYKGLRPSTLTNVPDGLNVLMKSCWDEYAKDRPSFNELSRFLRLAFSYVHEGDEEFFQLIHEDQSENWDFWSEQTIRLEHEHLLNREISHLTEDSNKTATRPVIDRQLSIGEFRRLLKDGNENGSPSPIQEEAPKKMESFCINTSLLTKIGIGSAAVGMVLFVYYRTTRK